MLAISWAGACQVALHAEGDDPHCDMPEGSKCPGTELTCQLGRCLPCIPKDEVCNGFDDNCDGRVDEGFDRDSDGYTTCQGDCNDDPATGGALVHPGATELCNGNDDNCNSKTDEESCPADKECWPDLKGCRLTGECCTVKGDCRKYGSCPSGTGCNQTTGLCDGASDCTTSGCIAGYECDKTLHTCVRSVKLGDSCNPPTEPCSEGTCVDGNNLGANNGDRICSIACCMAEDCPTGFVCKYALTGQSMCARASDLVLTTGSLPAHSKCTASAQCRSGNCSKGLCVDGCCGSLSCGDHGTCSLQDDNRILCRDSVGGSNPGDSCYSNENCKSGLCIGYTWFPSCSKRCCSSADCFSDETCVLLSLGGGSYAPGCQLTSYTPGTKRGGQPCLSAGDCRSLVCNDGRCSDSCCHDSDCDPATVCKPSASGPLRCLPR